MANNLVISASSLNDTLSELGLISQVNTAIAGLLDNTFSFVQPVARDRQRKKGRVLEMVITYEDTGEATLTSPYELTVFTASTAADAATQAAAFMAANPTYFFSAPIIQWLGDTPVSTNQFYIFLFYTEDGVNGAANWAAAGASGGTGGGGSPTGPAGGDLSGTYPNPTVDGIQNISVPVPAVGGSQLTYDITSGAYVWYVIQTYTSLANAAADQANQVIGAYVVIYSGSGQPEDGTYQLTAKTASPADYTKVSDNTDTASEVDVVDAGGFFDANDVESVLQLVGAGTYGFLETALAAATETTVASLSVDDYRQTTWELALADATTGQSEKWFVQATHDGTAGGDATVADYSVNGLGPVTGDIATIAVDLNGVGAAQVMRLRVEATPAGWTAKVRTLDAAPA